MLTGNMLIFGAIKVHRADSGGFTYFVEITQEIDFLIAWQIILFRMANTIGPLVDLCLLLLELKRCINKCLRKWKKEKAIELLEREKEEATGAEGPCPICYAEFEEGEEMYVLRCEHLFHKECLSRWMSKQINCPTCRVEVL